MRWPKYWSFSFSIIPSKEIPGLISFKMNWLDLLAVQGTLKSLLQQHSSKASILRRSAFFTVQLSHPYMTTGKTIALTRWTLVGKVMSLLLNMLSRFFYVTGKKTFPTRDILVFYICCSVAQSCPSLCNPTNCSMPGFPILHHYLELAQTHIHQVGDTIQPSHPLSPPSPPAFNLAQHQGSFLMSQFFTSGGQSIGASASASVLPMNIQG